MIQKNSGTRVAPYIKYAVITKGHLETPIPEEKRVGTREQRAEVTSPSASMNFYIK